MTDRGKTLFALLFCLCGAGSIPVSAEQTLQVVTMRNGEIHNGVLAVESYTISLPYGEVDLPAASVAAIDLTGGEAVIRTWQKERFQGELRLAELRIDRVLDVPLALQKREIATIDFDKAADAIPSKLPDRVVTRSGNAFAATVTTDAILFRHKAGIELVPSGRLRQLDIAARDEGHLARLIGDDGGIRHGQVLLGAISVKTGAGSPLEIPVEELVMLTLAREAGTPPGAGIFRHARPEEHFSDPMTGGAEGPLMAQIPGGVFLRGDHQGDGDVDEARRSEVRIAPFAIGVYEVTFGEYDRFCRETGREMVDDAGWGRGGRPVMNVSWEDAVAYAQWLSRRTGRSYRLPTDAEWEYAARAGSGSRYWWGDEPAPERANCEGCGSIWDGEQSAPVGSFPANPFGLHDTAGNLFEWVEDCWHDDFSQAPADGSALAKSGCVNHVIRGGAWSFPLHEIRSANRWRDFLSRRSDDTGFRVARDVAVGR